MREKPVCNLAIAKTYEIISSCFREVTSMSLKNCSVTELDIALVVAEDYQTGRSLEWPAETLRMAELAEPHSAYSSERKAVQKI